MRSLLASTLSSRMLRGPLLESGFAGWRLKGMAKPKIGAVARLRGPVRMRTELGAYEPDEGYEPDASTGEVNITDISKTSGYGSLSTIGGRYLNRAVARPVVPHRRAPGLRDDASDNSGDDTATEEETTTQTEVVAEPSMWDEAMKTLGTAATQAAALNIQAAGLKSIQKQGFRPKLPSSLSGNTVFGMSMGTMALIAAGVVGLVLVAKKS